ncbi:unnamed protein product [Mytilus coruscus]|uniref:DZIP3-like HEPN domain-containing protein n=1 Tax=Mytilus coruscus TaxID=42192 RepID=A0A6J8BLN9_MYTCO|nr:unnamed protein product [Mytilus coruscus]
MTDIDFLLLFECILNFAAEIVRDLATEKILKLHQTRLFMDFLKKAKHHLYHQWDKKNRTCCNCPITGRLIWKTGNLNTKIFEKLFAYVKTHACSNRPRTRNGAPNIEICICKYEEGNISMEDLDLCAIKSLCQYSPLSSLLTASEENQLDILINIRNKVCHAVKSNIFSEPELDLMRTEVSDALCNLSDIDKKYMKMIIKDKRQKSLKDPSIQELRLKIDQIEKDAQNCTDHMRTQTDQNKTLLTEVGDIRKAQERQEVEDKNFRDQCLKFFGEFRQTFKNVKATCSASKSTGTSSSTQGSLSEKAESGKEIDLKVKLKNIDEDKMRNGLEKETSTDINDGWKLYTVKHGCILLEMKTVSDTFSSEKILNSRMQALVKRILTAGEVNTSKQAEIYMELTIKSPLTTEEEKIIRNVFAEPSQLHSDFENKLSDDHITKGKSEAFQGMCSW